MVKASERRPVRSAMSTFRRRSRHDCSGEVNQSTQAMAPPTLPTSSPLLNQRQRTIALVGTPPEAHVKGNPVMAEIVDWHQPQPRRRRLFIFMLAVVLALIFSSRTVLSYYVSALWFGSLGYEDAFRKTLALQWTVFLAVSAVTFLILYGWFLAFWRVYVIVCL